MPGFVWATICIHLMDCQGRGSPPWETVEWLEPTLKRKGVLIAAFAQVLESPGATAVLDQRDRRPAALEALASLGCSLKQGPANHSGGSHAASRTWPAGSWFLHQLQWPGAQFKFAGVTWNGLSLVQPCAGPLRPLPCPLPSFSPADAERKAPEGVGSGEGWGERGCLPLGREKVPLHWGKHSQLPECPATQCCPFWQGWRCFGFICGVLEHQRRPVTPCAPLTGHHCGHQDQGPRFRICPREQHGSHF